MASTQQTTDFVPREFRSRSAGDGADPQIGSGPTGGDEPGADARSGSERVREIRERLVDVALIGFAVALCVTTPVSLLRAIDIGWMPLMTLTCVMTVAMWIVAAIRRHLGSVTKAAFVVSSGMLFSVVALFSLGLASFALPMFGLSAVLAVVFFGVRAGIACSVVAGLCIALAAIAFTVGGMNSGIDLERYAHAPTSWASATVGFVLIACVLVATLGRLDRDLWRLIVELDTVREGLRRQAAQDELTSLSNRRQFLSLAGSEMERIRRYGAPAYLAILDLDHFKRINDAHGHAMGDEALRRFARLLEHESRDADHPARLGGEEFALLMPATGENGALTVVERIREQWDGSAIAMHGEVVNSTVSIGITGIRSDDSSIEVAMHRADAALYQAKDEGRNRVVFEH